MKGHCLCGNVAIEVEDIDTVEACHCSMCRRWGSGPLMAVHSKAKPDIKGQNSITVYSSSDWAERAFCHKCGTNLYYHQLGSDEYVLSVGLFQDINNFDFTSQIFIDKKPDYYEFANVTVELTEQQLFDKFAKKGMNP
ncbi:GFA family protein [uncultured Psychrobacter sp.]|uniref:GFA family protein n=1 Tax=uncultured Psychrobacter sp. TaxID=259303 RepID=UPI00345941B3